MAYNQNRGYQENWFSRLLARKGNDYIDTGKLTDGEVSRNVDRIIDDIINGRIDYSIYGNYIIMPVVFDNLLSYCRNKVATSSAELYSLNYVNWACETGKIMVANTNYNPTNNAIPADLPTPFGYDAGIWARGISTITPTMKNTIMVALRDITIEHTKYSILTQALETVQSTKNIYELQWVTSSLKQYIRSNNKIIY